MSEYSALILSLGPMAYWRMSEASGSLVDATGRGHDAALGGGTPTYGQASALLSDTADRAVRLTAADSEYFTVPDHADLDLANTFTLMAWVKLASLGSFQSIVDKDAGAYQLRINTSNFVELTRSNVAIIATSNLALVSGAYYFIVATKVGSTVKIYINGIDRTGTVNNQTFVNSTSALAIGRAYFGGGSQYSDATIDELALFNKALSAAEVQQIYNQGVVLARPVPALSEEEVLSGSLGTVHWHFRYYRSNANGDRLEDVSDLIENGSIDMQVDREVRRHLSLQLTPSRRLAELGEYINVSAIVNPGQASEKEYPLGLFLLDFPRKQHSEVLTYLEYDAYDQNKPLLLATTTAPYTIAIEENIIEHVKSLLVQRGITKLNIPVSSKTMPAAATWPIGTPWLTIINDLLEGVGYYPGWFNVNGYFVSRPYDDLKTVAPSVTYRTDRNSLVLSPVGESVQAEDFANQVVVVSDDPENPISSVRTNEDAASSLSTVSLGYTKTLVVPARVIDQTAADVRAEYELQQASAVHREATLTTSLDPRRDVYEVYELDVYRKYKRSYPEEILAVGDDLLGYWRMGELSGDLIDRSGNDLNAPVQGNVLRGVQGAIVEDDGAIGLALTPGTPEAVTALSIPRSRIRLCTLELWIKIEDTSDKDILSLSGINGSGIALLISSGELWVRIADLGLLLNKRFMEVILPITEGWHHIVAHPASYASGWEVFLDGEQAGSDSDGSFVWPTSSNSMTIENVDGVFLDELALYQKLLTDEEVKFHYELGKKGADQVLDGRWAAMGWSMALEPGAPMRHTIRKVDPIV